MTVRGWALLEFAIEECHTLGLSLFRWLFSALGTGIVFLLKLLFEWVTTDVFSEHPTASEGWFASQQFEAHTRCRYNDTAPLSRNPASIPAAVYPQRRNHG